GGGDLGDRERPGAQVDDATLLAAFLGAGGLAEARRDDEGLEREIRSFRAGPPARHRVRAHEPVGARLLVLEWSVGIVHGVLSRAHRGRSACSSVTRPGVSTAPARSTNRAIS